MVSKLLEVFMMLMTDEVFGLLGFNEMLGMD